MKRFIEAECHLWGKNFSPEKLYSIENIKIETKNEPGEILKHGLYKNKKAPYGSCSIVVPSDITSINAIEWMAKFIGKNKSAFKKAGATRISMWIYWSGLQGNMEINSSDIKLISKLGIPLCMDYITITESEHEKMI